VQLLPSELSLVQDVLITVAAFVISIFYFYFCGWLQKKGLASSYVTRKLIHLGLAPIFLFTLVFYSGQWYSVYIALTTPLIYLVAIFMINTGIVSIETLTKTMSRSGDPKELLRGITYYIFTVIIVTILGWTQFPMTETSSPLSIFVITILAIGDGTADIIGRRINRMKFTILSEKSVPGSITMLITSIAACTGFLAFFGYDLSSMFFLVILIASIATLVEALSPGNVDNITVPLATVISYLILVPILIPTASWKLFYIHLP